VIDLITISQWLIVTLIGVLTLLLLASRIYYAQRHFRQQVSHEGADILQVMAQPSSVPPAVASVLIDPQPERLLDPQRAFQATLLDLARRGYVDFYSDVAKGRLGLVVNKKKSRSSLKPFERHILDFLRGGSKRFSQAGYLDVRAFEGKLGLHLESFFNKWRREPLGWAVNRFNLPTRGELYKQGQVVGFAFIQATSWQDAKRKRDLCYSIGRSFAGLSFIALVLWIMPPSWEVAGMSLDIKVHPASLSSLLLTALGCWGLGRVAMVAIPAWRPEVADKIRQWRAFRKALGSYRHLAKHAEDVLEQREKLATYAVALNMTRPFLRHLERLAKRYPDAPALSKTSRWTDARDVAGFVWLVHMVEKLHPRAADEEAQAKEKQKEKQAEETRSKTKPHNPNQSSTKKARQAAKPNSTKPQELDTY
jgi:hypothetical protein